MFSLTEIIFIGLIVLIFIGPKELPEVARTVGRLFYQMKRAKDSLTEEFRRSASDFKPPPTPFTLTEKKNDKDQPTT